MDERVIRGFGSESEQQDFLKRHKVFCSRFEDLKCLLDRVFIRKSIPSDLMHKVVFHLGRLCVEDFMEILLLCSNGYGIAAMRLLRGMYERAVTARYLSSHHHEVLDFVEFDHVTRRRLCNNIEATFGKGTMPQDEVEQVEAQYQRVYKRYVVPICQQCKTERVNYTWTTLDFVSMAHKTGQLGNLVVHAYYLPTEQAHCTAGAILSRLEEKDGGMTFMTGAQRKEADQVLITAHSIIMDTIDLQKEVFGLNQIEAALEVCKKHFFEIWGDPPQER